MVSIKNKLRLIYEIQRVALILIILEELTSCAMDRKQIDLRYSPIIGTETAKTEIIIFSDFQCPFCKKAAKELEEAAKEVPNCIKIYYKYFPLNYHLQATNAAKAAEAARLQGKFWQMHDLLFAYSQELKEEIYPVLAEKVGLDVNKFNKDIRSFETANRVLADQDEGYVIGLKWVPLIIIDGKKYLGANANLAETIIAMCKDK